ncbi:SRPBCC family protein [Spiractinospora alimapuensis]|uniref:SRPBCC family protein n=1 Tax=Spiractinospora alimapuensis TaxID=2820884 RepID=UPI001F3E03E8|nr:SRPBCC family protein [Spiractinospora alimapuensis]QVQ52728.1 SRPBCC family protein [Spiractinospora alimapuensis]
MGQRENQIDRVHRVVGRATVDGGPGYVVTLDQTYETDVADLWDACTTAERLSRWLGPVTGELTLGRRYQIQDNAGGTIQRCERPRELALTWEFDGEATLLEVRLTPEGTDLARLELRHHAPDNEFWRRYGPGATGTGWEYALFVLAGYIEGWGDDMAAEEAWFSSPEGQRFTADSSQRWADAATTAGEDPALATLRARRVTAFFTGQPEPE